MKESANKGKKRTHRDYTLGFKLAVVDLVEKGELTYKQAQMTFGIQGRSTLLVSVGTIGKRSFFQSS